MKFPFTFFSMKMAFLLIGFLTAASSRAANIWDGGGGADQKWSTAANWDNNTVPTSGSTTQITLGLATATTPNMDLATPWQLQKLTILGNGNTTLTGNALSFVMPASGGGSFYALDTSGGNGVRTIENDLAVTFAGNDSNSRFQVTSGTGGLILKGNLTITLNGESIAILRGANAITVDGVISGPAGTATSLAKTDAGTVTLNNGGNLISNFSLNAGTVVLGADNALGNGVALAMGNANVTAGNGVLNLNGKNQTVGSLAKNATPVNQAFIQNAAGTASTLTYSRSSTDETLDFIQLGNTGANNLNFVKAGTNVLTLTKAATYTGLTDVQAGTLRYGASNVIASGAVQVSGGTLDLATFSDTVGAVTLQSGSITGTTGTLTGTSYAVQSGSISAKLGGSGGLTKSTPGTVTLTGVNAYTGSTLISAGTLVVSGSGSINTSSGVTVDGGTLNYSSSTNLTAALTFTSGTLAGTNYTGKTLSIGTNQTLSPGNSTGTLTSAALTWAGGGTYQWQINDATGAAGGNGWDLLTTGTLTLSATAGSKFNLNVASLSSQLPGAAANFDPAQNYAWLIADAASAITAFDADAFDLNLTGFQNANDGIWSVALGGTGGIGGDSSQIYLVYSAIPEPSALLLFAGGLAAVLFRRRRSV